MKAWHFDHRREVTHVREDDVDESGDLEVLHVDHATPGNDFYLHVLSTPKGKFSLHFAGKAPNLKTGDRVRVRGKKLDQAIVLAAGGASPAPVEVVGASALPRTVGAEHACHPRELQQCADATVYRGGCAKPGLRHHERLRP